ncbi:MAG: sigma-54 dependent transcriptional regulator [Salinivirgaceae bacterium]
MVNKLKRGNILLIDDNKSVLSALKMLIEPHYNYVKCITSPKTLPSLLEAESFDVVLLDMNFSAGVNTGNEGLYWLKRILEFSKVSSVIMITAYGDVELAVRAVKEGATDFILKPWDNHKLLSTVHSAYQLSSSRREVTELKTGKEHLLSEINRTQETMIGQSDAFKTVLAMVQKVAKTDANVLITGENGTGKELVAQELHRLSTRRNEILVSVDMGAIPDTLFESELFGHVKGAFTDAHADKPGKFETAHKGTLFLDEIGNLPLAMQSKLLAAVQTRQITRIGSNKPIEVDIRLICATNSHLEQMVAEGAFREDLLYRINTIHIEVPPLRERVADILPLAEFFLRKYAEKYGKPNLVLTDEALEKLKSYSWPGNIRELQHCMEKASILCEKTNITPTDFYFKSQSTSTRSEFSGSLEEMEKAVITKTLARHEGNLSAAAKQLGITRQTLYNKMSKFSL